MIKRILLLGLILLPFYELIIYMLMPQGKIPEWIDLRVTKEYISLGLGLTLTVAIWNKVKRIECPNKWTLLFLVFMFINISKTPISVIQPIIDVSLLGSYSAEFKVFAFFLMFCSLSSCRFSKEFIEKILFTIFISAVVMSGYMILQACNLDQIFKPKAEYMMYGIGVKGIRVAGFFGQPTLAVPFLSMSLPFAVYFKKKWSIVLISVAMLLTQSDFAVICLALLLLSYLWKNKKMFIGLSAFFLTAFSTLLYYSPKGFFSTSGRFEVWKMILQDVFTGEINNVPVRIGMFGAGLNNFGKIFTALHSTSFTRAHNEPLQVLWTCGVIGLGIFLMIHFDVFKTAFKARKNPMIKPIAIALMCLVLCSMGTFVYQLGVYQFFVVVLAALIYQLKAIELEGEDVRIT